MKMMTRIMVAIALMIILSIVNVAALSEFEENDSQSNSKYQEIDIYVNGFDISSNGLASCLVRLETHSTDRTVKVYAYIQRYENGRWITVKSGNASDDDGDVKIYMQLMVASGYDYRLKSYAYVYQDGVRLESDSYESDEISYY